MDDQTDRSVGRCGEVPEEETGRMVGCDGREGMDDSWRSKRQYLKDEDRYRHLRTTQQFAQFMVSGININEMLELNVSFSRIHRICDFVDIQK